MALFVVVATASAEGATARTREFAHLNAVAQMILADDDLADVPEPEEPAAGDASEGESAAVDPMPMKTAVSLCMGLRRTGQTSLEMRS